MPDVTDEEYHEIAARLQRNCGEHFGVTNYSVMNHIAQLRNMRWADRKPEIIKYLLYWRGIGRYNIILTHADSKEERDRKMHVGMSEALIAARVLLAPYWVYTLMTEQQTQTVTREIENAEGFSIGTQHVTHNGLTVVSNSTDGHLAAVIATKK